MEPMRWNNADPNPGARPQTSVFRGDKGLDVANQTRASGGGRKMFLTSPYIEQAIALRMQIRPPPLPRIWRKNGSASSCPRASRAVLPHGVDFRARVSPTHR